MEIEASAPCVSVGSRGCKWPGGVNPNGPEQDLRDRVARALARVDRLDATQAREKAYAEERAAAKATAEPSTKRSWWRLAR
jgi:hypothetical protein